MILLALFLLANAIPNDDTVTNSSKYLDLEQSFNFVTDCGTLDEFKCKAAKASLEDVGDLIASQLLFKVPVNICSKFKTLKNLYNVEAKAAKFHSNYCL